MTYRKTWFGYVLLVLYSILCIVLLAQSGNVWVSYLAGIPYTKGFPDSVIAPFSGLSGSVLFGLGMIVIPVTALLYWGIRTLVAKIGKKCVRKEKTVRVAEGVAVAFVMAAGILLRINNASSIIPMLEDEGFLLPFVSGTEYYDLAVVTREGSVPFLDDGAAYCYVVCLSTLMSFLGNKMASAVILQVFLQIAGLGLSYVVTRKIAGRLPACTVLIYLACSPACLRMLTCFGPEWLFFDCYLVGMLILVCFVKDYCANQFSRLMAVFGAVAAGLVAGLISYLDITAITLLAVTVAAATGKKTRQEENNTCYSPKMNATVIATVILSCVLGWICAVGMAAYVQGIHFVDCCRTWVRLHIDNTQTFGFKVMFPYIWDIYLIGVLVVFASFLVFEFFRSGKEQNFMLWLLLCILIAPTPLAVSGVHAFGMLSLYIWGVLAGLGLQNSIFGGKVKLMQETIEEINTTAQEPVQKPRFIENPLPLPKKHVKKEMDYQYQVPEEKMKYDVEVSQQDDYDIE